MKRNKIKDWEAICNKYSVGDIITGKVIKIERFGAFLDIGEDFQSAAKRELLEETGYSGKIEKQSPVLFSSPGIISETFSFVNVSVDENNYKNTIPMAKGEPGEFITVFLKYPEEIQEFFSNESKQGVLFDAKLYTYFMALGIL